MSLVLYFFCGVLIGAVGGAGIAIYIHHRKSDEDDFRDENVKKSFRIEDKEEPAMYRCRACGTFVKENEKCPLDCNYVEE